MKSYFRIGFSTKERYDFSFSTCGDKYKDIERLVQKAASCQMEKHKLGRMNLYKMTWLVVDRFKVSSVYSLIKRMYYYMADRFISLSHVHKACCRGYLQSTTSICTFQHRFTTLFLKFQFYSQIDQ